MVAPTYPETLRNGIDAAEEDLAGLIAGLETVAVLTDRLRRRLAALRTMVARSNDRAGS